MPTDLPENNYALPGERQVTSWWLVLFVAMAIMTCCVYMATSSAWWAGAAFSGSLVLTSLVCVLIWNVRAETDDLGSVLVSILREVSKDSDIVIR